MKIVVLYQYFFLRKLMNSYSSLKFTNLPKNYADVSYKGSQIACPVLENIQPKFFCLFCGMYFCYPGFCCMENSEDKRADKEKTNKLRTHSSSGYFAFMK